MTKEDYNKLVDDLIKYSDSYYNKNVSLISDKEFDILLKKIELIEGIHNDWIREDSPTQIVGIGIEEESRKIKHDEAMLSLGNTYNEDEVRKFYNDMVALGATEFVVEYKYDGVSFSSKHKDASITQGLTRGDGQYGEKIEFINLIEGLDASALFEGEVRGEVLMEKAEFDRINVDGKYANPRNLTSGTIKLQDEERFKQRKLNAYVYWWVGAPKTRKHSENLDLLKSYGFNTGSHWVVNTFDDLWTKIEEIGAKKANLPFEIDGAVIKVNDTSLWESIGFTSKFPKWAKAYKYEPDTAITTVKDIEFWVGGTGKITPVAYFEPIFLSGTQVNKATLNNKEYMETLDIQIGDKVNIKKAAEIIPFINHVVKEERATDGQTRTLVSFPTHCPDCNSKLAKYDSDHADYYCMNEECPSRVARQIEKYTTAMNIDGFAEAIIDKLYTAGLLTSIEDLYKLKNHKKTMVGLPRMGERLVNKLLKNIESNKTKKLEKFLSAISIKNVGKNTSKQLAHEFKNIKLIMGATEDEFMLIDDIGPIVAKSIYEYFKDPKNKVFIKNMIDDYGLILEAPEDVDESAELVLQDKAVCITGALSLVRTKYVELIESCGGKVVSGVSKKTNYLITNNKDSGTTKNIKAKNLGIPILNEKELLELCSALELLKELDEL